MAERYEERYRGDDWRRERGYGREHERDRGFIERAGDEVRSWFGDEEAERRRRMDEARYGRDWDRYGREWDRYGREPERYGREREYGRDWDYGHRMGMGYDRPRGERGWGEERFGSGERDYGQVDYWRSGGPSYWNEPGYGRSAYTRTSGAGPYSGRGPRNYQRSDDRLREDVCERLTRDSWIDASDVEVTVRGGEVTLSGSVRDRTDKRRVEDLAEQVSGVREVHNNLRVAGGWERERETTPTREQTTAGATASGTTSRR